MNRLWIRLSVVIGLVILVVVLFPIVERQVGLIPQPAQQPPPFPYPNLPPESVQGLQSYFEGFFWQRTLTTLLAGALIGVIAGVISSRWLTAPLSRLEKAVQAISRHQFNTRVPEKGSLEVKSLAHSFNQMAFDLESAEALRRNLLADVSHELRHPAHLLQGNLQAIQDGVYPLNMEEIGRLSEQAHHLTNLINDLYLLAQAEAQQLPLNCQITDLEALVQSAVEPFQTSATNRQVRLNIDPPAQPVSVEIDVMRMRQVIQNILDNALRHTPGGGAVRLSLDGNTRQAHIVISDTGEGIPPEQLAYIFDRFHRGDSSRSRADSNGAGLGLAIAQAFVQAHGGQVSVQSAAGQGSVFTITLPIPP